jgi:hypothetical protein
VPGQGTRNWTQYLQALYYVVPLSYAIARIF